MSFPKNESNQLIGITNSRQKPSNVFLHTKDRTVYISSINDASFWVYRWFDLFDKNTIDWNEPSSVQICFHRSLWEFRFYFIFSSFSNRCSWFDTSLDSFKLKCFSVTLVKTFLYIWWVTFQNEIASKQILLLKILSVTLTRRTSVAEYPVFFSSSKCWNANNFDNQFIGNNNEVYFLLSISL